MTIFEKVLLIKLDFSCKYIDATCYRLLSACTQISLVLYARQTRKKVSICFLKLLQLSAMKDMLSMMYYASLRMIDVKLRGKWTFNLNLFLWNWRFKKIWIFNGFNLNFSHKNLHNYCTNSSNFRYKCMHYLSQKIDAPDTSQIKKRYFIPIETHKMS